MQHIVQGNELNFITKHEHIMIMQLSVSLIPYTLALLEDS